MRFKDIVPYGCHKGLVRILNWYCTCSHPSRVQDLQLTIPLAVLGILNGTLKGCDGSPVLRIFHLNLHFACRGKHMRRLWMV